MNYSDEILENKSFNFFKQLMYNIVVAICIILAVCLILVYGFKFRPYEVLSNSQAPYFTVGDMVIVKGQDSYEVGDIIKFDHNGVPTTHRLIAIKEYQGTTYYICHGDNVQNTDGSYDHDYQWEIDRLTDMTYEEILNGTDENDTKLVINVQIVTEADIEGKVVASLNNWGSYFSFINAHKLLIIAIIVSVWCVSATVQNELDIRRTRRLFL
ncbi:MAG TPA: signal peptidase I [Candidatus Onthoplasma faecigallinarum]|nr:signal peptidase I [Candidatus Onthoplasma faecigallinarum]